MPSPTQDTATAPPAAGHRPVMVREVIAVIEPKDGGIYIDGTFGAGGYSRALLEAAACRVCAIDRDPAVLAAGAALARQFPGRLTLITGRFSEMEELLRPHGLAAVDGVALDLGVSSMQLDDAARGFSFRFDGPLDMRMGADGPSAQEVINSASQEALADLIHAYGEERRARAIARAIVTARRQAPIVRTTQLAEIVRRVVRRGSGGMDPATRTFQALRIHVNDELGELDSGLAAAERLLKTAGRLVVVSFHSLEDRRVKSFLRTRSGDVPAPSRHAPPVSATILPDPSFTLPFRRARKPSAAELAANARARSARLRAGKRTAAPAWPERWAA